MTYRSNDDSMNHSRGGPDPDSPAEAIIEHTAGAADEPAPDQAAAAAPGSALSPSQQIAAALKRERLRAGLSLSEVARRAGIGKSTMSGLETGSGNPSLETMWALAAALDIPLARLLDPPPHEVAFQHVGDMPSLPSTTANYVATLLSPSPTNARRDVYFIQAEPGEPRESQPHPQGTIEHVVLGRGAARIEVLGKSYDLGVGDYLTHPGDQPHRFTALEPGTNAVFIVESS
jgi:transcriptional regulator with XRE-family HTH domain